MEAVEKLKQEAEPALLPSKKATNLSPPTSFSSEIQTFSQAGRDDDGITLKPKEKKAEFLSMTVS